MKKNIAVVGSGIAGLTAAYFLSRHHKVTVYEANDYIGGHTHTVDIEFEGERQTIDTGFIVFNNRTYPNFIRLLSELSVSYQPTEMSFSVRNDKAGLEYNGHNIRSMFAQPSNVANPAFYRMIYDIVRFNQVIKNEIEIPTQATIGEHLDRKQYGRLFADNYLLPMIAAIWSMGLTDVRDFPLQFFAKFFHNHGLLDLTNRPQWYTIAGGSSSYIAPLTKPFEKNIHLSTPVKQIVRRKEGVDITGTNGFASYDAVILACHGDQALSLLAEPTPREKEVLSAFRFTQNRVILHTDESQLPERKKAWASWNYLVANDNDLPTLTYNMNILQRLKSRHNYLVTLNRDIAEDKILKAFTYHHPAFTPEVIKAQNRWHEISGVDNVHYCGAYWLNGFHEDGVKSGMRVCSSLGVDI